MIESPSHDTPSLSLDHLGELTAALDSGDFVKVRRMLKRLHDCFAETFY